ncbi:hypothetical protein D3C71_1698300 [compost metagenome]
MPADTGPGTMGIQQVLGRTGKHLMPPMADRMHINVRILITGGQWPVVHTGDKAVAAAPVGAELGLPVPNVGPFQPLQALRRRRLMMVGQTIDVDPDASIGGSEFTSLGVTP